MVNSRATELPRSGKLHREIFISCSQAWAHVPVVNNAPPLLLWEIRQEKDMRIQSHRPRARTGSRDVSRKELYQQAELEGDVPYAHERRSALFFFKQFAEKRYGRRMTDLQRSYESLEVNKLDTAGEIRENLRGRALKKAAVGLGLTAAGAGAAVLSHALGFHPVVSFALAATGPTVAWIDSKADASMTNLVKTHYRTGKLAEKFQAARA